MGVAFGWVGTGLCVCVRVGGTTWEEPRSARMGREGYGVWACRHGDVCPCGHANARVCLQGRGQHEDAKSSTRLWADGVMGPQRRRCARRHVPGSTRQQAVLRCWSGAGNHAPFRPLSHHHTPFCTHAWSPDRAPGVSRRKFSRPIIKPRSSSPVYCRPKLPVSPYVDACCCEPSARDGL